MKFEVYKGIGGWFYRLGDAEPVGPFATRDEADDEAQMRAERIEQNREG